MRVLITGATGFLGSHLTELLVREGANVAVLVRPQSDTWRIHDVVSQVTRIEGDLGNLQQCQTLIADYAPHVVYHLGWSGVGNAYRNDASQIDQNLQSTITLARIAKEIRCSAFVGLGSQAEYGPCQQTINETMPTNPTTLYGAAKLSAYHLCRATLNGSGVRFAWMRLFSCYGPKDNPEWMLPGLIRSLAVRNCPSLTAGEQCWDYIFVKDAARAIQQVGECERAEGVFNLGSGEALPLRSIIEQVRDLIDPTLSLGFGEIPYRPDQVMFLEADISRLANTTAWQPRIHLSEGLTGTVEWFRNSTLRKAVA